MYAKYINKMSKTEVITILKQIDMTKWQYNSDNDVYWQVGISYCANPVNKTYEILGLYVPGAYFNETENGDGTYTCEINENSAVGNYTAKTAPIVFPVNTPGYSAMVAPTSYTDVSTYTHQGFVYMYAGCRGRDAGVPAGVTDLKAAVRYIRYNKNIIPGSMERIFSFGMSGGGAQSALMGTTGDSDLYTPYLEEIGAVSGVSDSIIGSMCWCPITNLDVADAAYEWNLGSARSDLDDDTQKLSNGLAEEFAKYINKLGLKDENGKELVLEKSDSGIYQSGTYYNYIKSTIEKSLSDFLSDTQFQSQNSVSASFSRGFAAVQDYIDSLNSENQWINYDSKTNTVAITSVSDFVKACKTPWKSVGAFDNLDKSVIENVLFGYGDGNGAHFDAMEAELLAGTDYETDFIEDFKKTDLHGNTVDTRVNMYNPMYYLCDYYDGNGSSNIAKYFRIRTGIQQGDTALCTEVDLALALKAKGTDVDFETVWGQAHVKAERIGDSDTNFIEWVNECLK